MTDVESRLAVLESRDKDTRELLRDIDTKLDELTSAFQTRQHCPAPGSCLTIGKELDQAKDCLKVHSREIERLARWQMYVFGAAGAVVVGWTVGITIIPLIWR